MVQKQEKEPTDAKGQRWFYSTVFNYKNNQMYAATELRSTLPDFMRVGSPLSAQPCRGSQLAEEPQDEVVGRAVHGGWALASTVHSEHFPLPPMVNSMQRLGFPTLRIFALLVLNETNSPGNSLLASPESSK